MLLTDLIRWPARSHRQACRNALHGSMEMARHRRDLADAERFVDEVTRRRADVRSRAAAYRGL